MTADRLAFDRGSVRTVDADGRLHLLIQADFGGEAVLVANYFPDRPHRLFS